jgi:hypothetical protein
LAAQGAPQWRYHSRRYEKTPSQLHKHQQRAGRFRLQLQPDFFEAWWTRRWPCQKLGATDAGAEASEGCGLSVSVRKGELETVERNRDKSLGVTVYLGQRRGNASTSDFSEAAIKQTVQAAYDIARFTAEDPWPACPTPPTSPCPAPTAIWTCSTLGRDQRRGRRMALAARRPPWAPPRITNSEGAGVSAQQSHFFSAHTRAFAAAMPARATACRWRPSPRCPARTARCSATTGTAPCAPPIWPRPRPWAATPPSAR